MRNKIKKKRAKILNVHVDTNGSIASKFKLNEHYQGVGKKRIF